MKRLLAVALAVMMLGIGSAFAQVTQFSVKDHLVVGVEANYNELDLDDVKLLTIDVPGFAGGELDLYGHEFDVSQQLVSVGYKLSDQLTPYVLLGMTDIDANIRLKGSASIPGWSGGADLLEIPFDGSPELTWGFGLKGDMIEVPAGIILGYDVRMTACDATEDTNIVVLPGIWGYQQAARSEIEYLQWDAILSAKKVFVLGKDDANRKFFKSVTPMVGFKYTNTQTETKLSTTIDIGPGINIASEQNVVSNLYSAVGGVNVAITDNIDLCVGGSVGGVNGVNGKVTYKF